MTSHNPTLKNAEDAQVGIGTMIVFIATVLVAAVAAGVLINVSGDLSSQATSTGNQATDNVATSLAVDSIIGSVTSDEILQVDIFVRLGAGSESVPLDELLIHRSNGGTFATSQFETGTTASTTGGFIAMKADKDLDGTPTADDLLQKGDYIVLRVDVDSVAAEKWLPGQQVSVQLTPSIGSPITVDFTVPKTLSDAKVVLY